MKTTQMIETKIVMENINNLRRLVVSMTYEKSTKDFIGAILKDLELVLQKYSKKVEA